MHVPVIVSLSTVDKARASRRTAFEFGMLGIDTRVDNIDASSFTTGRIEHVVLSIGRRVFLMRNLDQAVFRRSLNNE